MDDLTESEGAGLGRTVPGRDVGSQGHHVLGDFSSALTSLCEEADPGRRVQLTPAS